MAPLLEKSIRLEYETTDITLNDLQKKYDMKDVDTSEWAKQAPPAIIQACVGQQTGKARKGLSVIKISRLVVACTLPLMSNSFAGGLLIVYQQAKQSDPVVISAFLGHKASRQIHSQANTDMASTV